MHEQPRDGARSRVEVFIRTPSGGVDVPVVEVQGHVADGVGQVPDDEDATGAREGGDGADVEELAGVELDPREEEERGCGGVRGDCGEDVGGGEGGRAGCLGLDRYHAC